MVAVPYRIHKPHVRMVTLVLIAMKDLANSVPLTLELELTEANDALE